MAHFAEIDNDNIVKQVIVVDNSVLIDEFGNENEELGRQFCSQLLGGNWIQTSYNKKLRKNFAGIGHSYDASRDAFVPPKPYPSWILDENTYQWQAPIPYPESGDFFEWSERLQKWIG